MYKQIEIVGNEEKEKNNSLYIDQPEKYQQISKNWDKEYHFKNMLEQYNNHEGAREIHAIVSKCLGKALDETQKEQKERVTYAKPLTAGISLKITLIKRKNFVVF